MVKTNRRKIATRFFSAAVAILCTSSSAISDDQQSNKIRLNAVGLAYAGDLINQGRVVADKRGAWKEHQPSATEENEFIRQHGFGEYAKWHLGIDDRYAENTKRRYKFPFGDFKNAHRCALLAAKSRAAEYKHHDIEGAAVQLIQIISSKQGAPKLPYPYLLCVNLWLTAPTRAENHQ
jgi:hypothetical protein